MNKMEKLERLKGLLDKGRLSAFTWTIRTKAECAESTHFDPPCAYLEGRLGIFHIEICDDGEYYASASSPDGNEIPGVDGTIDMKQAMPTVEYQLYQRLAKMR